MPRQIQRKVVLEEKNGHFDKCLSGCFWYLFDKQINSPGRKVFMKRF